MSGSVSTLGDMGKRGGGVSRIGADKWRARLRIDGREIALGVYGSEAEARAVVDAAYSETAGALVPGDDIFGAWGLRWLDERERSTRVRGIRQERSCWRRHVLGSSLGSMPLRAITRAGVARWVTAIVDGGASTQTAKHALRLVRTCLQTAADRGEVAENVALEVKAPIAVEDDAAPAWAWLTTDEIAALLGAEEVPQWARDVWAVAIFTGLRKGELAGLRWQDVELGARPMLRVYRSYRQTTKSGKGREVPLLPPAREALERIRERTPGIGAAPVFPSGSGGVWSGHSWDPGGWRRYALGATRPDSGGVLDRHVRFHDLRHTCASHLVQGTWLATPMDLYRVKEWLGHSSIGVTQRYAHLAPGGIHDLAATFASGHERAGGHGHGSRKGAES